MLITVITLCVYSYIHKDKILIAKSKTFIMMIKTSNLTNAFAQMSRKLCLQNRIKLVDICLGWLVGFCGCIINCKLAELEGGCEESGGGAEI
jgi:hypothetical protein